MTDACRRSQKKIARARSALHSYGDASSLRGLGAADVRGVAYLHGRLLSVVHGFAAEREGWNVESMQCVESSQGSSRRGGGAVHPPVLAKKNRASRQRAAPLRSDAPPPRKQKKELCWNVESTLEKKKDRVSRQRRAALEPAAVAARVAVAAVEGCERTFGTPRRRTGAGGEEMGRGEEARAFAARRALGFSQRGAVEL